jgi:hypothetical protein
MGAGPSGGAGKTSGKYSVNPRRKYPEAVKPIARYLTDTIDEEPSRSGINDIFMFTSRETTLFALDADATTC